MKTTHYRFGGTAFKATLSSAGHGWEVCVTWHKKNLFVGNFIHKAEAVKWWNLMNGEIRSFTKTYWIANKNATTWYANFISNHLYKCYYKFLDKVFVKHTRTYATAVSKNVKKYRTISKGWHHSNRLTVKAA